MSVDPIIQLIGALQRSANLAPVELAELIRRLPAGFSDPEEVAREFLERGWLTVEQCAQVFPGQEKIGPSRPRETILIGYGEDDNPLPNIDTADADWSLRVEQDEEANAPRPTEGEAAQVLAVHAPVPSAPAPLEESAAGMSPEPNATPDWSALESTLAVERPLALLAASERATPSRMVLGIGAAALIGALFIGLFSVSAGLWEPTSGPRVGEAPPNKLGRSPPTPRKSRPTDEKAAAKQPRSDVDPETKRHSPAMAKESLPPPAPSKQPEAQTAPPVPPKERQPQAAPPPFCKLDSRLILGGTDQPQSFGQQQAVAFRDSLLLATGTRNGRVIIWRADGASAIRSWKAHPVGVNSLAFHPNGRLLASASDDHSVKLWQIETGREVRTLGGHSDAVLSVSISPDGLWIASGSADGKVRAWRTASGAAWLTSSEPHRPDAPTSSSVRCVAFGPDSHSLAYGTDNGEVQLLDIYTRTPRLTLARQDNAVEALAFGPDGRVLATANRGGAIMLWDAANGREWQRMQDPADQAVTSLVFAGGGRILASGSGDGIIRLWDPNTGQLLDNIWAAAGRTHKVAVSHDGRCLASVRGRRTVDVFQIVYP